MTPTPMLLAMSSDERALLRDALRWAYDQGWVRQAGRHPIWLSPDLTVTVLTTSLCVYICRPGRTAAVVSADRVGDIIAVLADLRILPARFSRLAHAAMVDFALHCEHRAVQLILEHHGPDALAATGAWGWFAAAAAARTHQEQP